MTRDDSLTSLTTIHTPPSLSVYTPIEDHQAQTPATFYSAKPVLHYYGAGASALVRTRGEAEKLVVFGSEPLENATALVDVFVGSE